MIPHLIKIESINILTRKVIFKTVYLINIIAIIWFFNILLFQFI